MSTKTSLLKRIAQTAAVALLGGVFSTVALPSANAGTISSIGATCVARGGVGGFINVTYAGGDGVEFFALFKQQELRLPDQTTPCKLT